MISGRLGLREWDQILRKAALWTYWKGAYRDAGRDEGATIVLQTQGKTGWFWYIPLHNDVVSVGVVAGFDYLFKNREGKSHEAIYFEEVDRCPEVKRRIAGGTRCDEFHVQKEYSYHSKQAAGDGWVLGRRRVRVSRSALFLRRAAGTQVGPIGRRRDCRGAGQRDDTSAAQLGKWGPEFKEGMDRMRRLVVEYYEGFSFGRFVKKNPGHKGHSDRPLDRRPLQRRLLRRDVPPDRRDEERTGQPAGLSDSDGSKTLRHRVVNSCGDWPTASPEGTSKKSYG